MSDSSEAAEASETVDQAVLRLRGKGQTYARISRDLGLARGVDAQRAFVRALADLPPADAKQVRAEEQSRLDRLVERVRGDTDQNEADLTKRLQAIERMRAEMNRGN